MPYLTRKDIPEHIRLPHLERYRQELKKQLENPLLTEEQRRRLRQLLKDLQI